MAGRGMNAVLAGTMLLITLGGCASERLTYGKPGVVPAERQRDENECLRAAVDSRNEGGHPLSVVRLDREAYVRCMESRGYTREK